MPTSKRYVMGVNQTLAEKKNMTVRNGFLLVYFVFATLPLVAVFDSEGARKAIDNVKQQLATSQAKKMLSAVQTFNDVIKMAEQSGYALNADIKNALGQCKNLVLSGTPFFAQVPGQQDIDALEGAYAAYASGVEKNNTVMVEDLVFAQQESEKALSELTAAFQVVMTELTRTKLLVETPLVDDGMPFVDNASASSASSSGAQSESVASSTPLNTSVSLTKQVVFEPVVDSPAILTVPKAPSSQQEELPVVNDNQGVIDTDNEDTSFVDEGYSQAEDGPVPEDGEELNDSEIAAE